ncbi:MAG: hypothetical protein LBQ35_09260 [Spirochaetaceae bacterium]|jgi:hypothetical protein|nr:hypothetical protein [Spirochaetaceae bacterium]
MRETQQTPGLLLAHAFDLIKAFVPRLAAALALLSACETARPADFPAPGALYGLSPEAAAGRLRPGEVLRYSFDPPLTIAPDLSLEFEYRPPVPAAGWKILLSLEDGFSGLWELPAEAWGLPPGGSISYAAPLPPGLLSGFSLAAGEGAEGDLRITAIRLIPRRYGIEAVSGGLRLSPFVYRDAGGRFTIEPPEAYPFSRPPELILRGLGEAELDLGGRRYAYRPAQAEERRLPPGLLRPEGPLALSPSRFEALILSLPEPPPSTPGPAYYPPVPLDPGLIPGYPRENWRDRRFEVFRWDEFPGIIIFDTADYEVQSRLFKRLAFFVEKAGYRSRLVPDAELAGLHGWNAHDYNAGDLAAFFEAARRSGFPLLPEEAELRDLLLACGVLRLAGGGIAGGEGAALSLSRESPDYLRRRFLVHECYHGLYFLDRDFRDFAARRWEGLEDEARRFFRSYLDSQRYDQDYPYLVINEFMAYCLQQPAGQAGPYFGEFLARQIDGNSWRRAVLPPASLNPDGSRAWPGLGEAFSREARAFSDYVYRRWGFSAGSIGRFSPLGD